MQLHVRDTSMISSFIFSCEMLNCCIHAVVLDVLDVCGTPPRVESGGGGGGARRVKNQRAKLTDVWQPRKNS